MKLSPLAERLIAKADAKRSAAIAAPASTHQECISVPLSPELAKLPARLKVLQVAEYLCLSTAAVINLKDAGELEFINIAVRGASRPAWRVTRDSLALFEQRRKTRAK